MTPTRETIARAICQDIELHGRGSGYVGGDSDLSDVCIDANCDLLSAADAVLRALDAAGLAVVPKEASAEMIAAMADSRASEDEWLLAPLRDMIGFCAEDRGDGILRAAYRAMIATAPAAG